MQDYKIGSNDIKEIDNLIKTTTSIYNLYQRLFKLEVEGKKDTNDYLKNYVYFN